MWFGDSKILLRAQTMRFLHTAVFAVNFAVFEFLNVRADISICMHKCYNYRVSD